MSWSATLIAVLALLNGGALVQFLRSRPQIKQIEADREANLLKERAAEMELMRERLAKLEKKLEMRETEHAAERAIDRHRINNVTACFEALLFMLENLDEVPVKVSQAVSRIRDMRAKQQEAEAIEKSSIHASKIAAVNTLSSNGEDS